MQLSKIVDQHWDPIVLFAADVRVHVPLMVSKAKRLLFRLHAFSKTGHPGTAARIKKEKFQKRKRQRQDLLTYLLPLLLHMK